jgi:hypothetical protein
VRFSLPPPSGLLAAGKPSCWLLAAGLLGLGSGSVAVAMAVAGDPDRHRLFFFDFLIFSNNHFLIF